MITFKAATPRNRIYFLKNILVWMFLLSIPFLFAKAFPDHYITTQYLLRKNSYITISLFILVSAWIRNASISRISMIGFDPASKEIKFTRDKLFYSQQSKILSFENLQIIAAGFLPNGLPETKSASVFFERDGRRLMEISYSKDGFSIETLSGIVKAAGELGLNVKTLTEQQFNHDV